MFLFRFAPVLGAPSGLGPVPAAEQAVALLANGRSMNAGVGAVGINVARQSVQ